MKGLITSYHQTCAYLSSRVSTLGYVVGHGIRYSVFTHNELLKKLKSCVLTYALFESWQRYEPSNIRILQYVQHVIINETSTVCILLVMVLPWYCHPYCRGTATLTAVLPWYYHMTVVVLPPYCHSIHSHYHSVRHTMIYQLQVISRCH